MLLSLLGSRCLSITQTKGKICCIKYKLYYRRYKLVFARWQWPKKSNPLIDRLIGSVLQVVGRVQCLNISQLSCVKHKLKCSINKSLFKLILGYIFHFDTSRFPIYASLSEAGIKPPHSPPSQNILFSPINLQKGKILCPPLKQAN